ncbi:MAG: hypothetical protein KDA78_18030, partial [Planctomycetaceae bacterium]|nr:hypothetical protein [Planctomycetaceae bacterium]
TLPGQPADSSQEESPLAIEPVGEVEQFEAVVLLSNLGRLDLANKYLQAIVAANLPDDQLLALRDRFGTVELVRLARTEELLPAAQQLLDQVAAASERNALDPARIDRILQDLEGSPRERELAITELRRLGPLAMPRLIQRLSSPENGQEKDQIVYLFSRMGNQVTPALLAALDTDNALLKATLLDSLGIIGGKQDVTRLAYYAFSESESKIVNQSGKLAIARILHGANATPGMVDGYGTRADLMQRAMLHLKREVEWDANDRYEVTFWVWDAAQSTVVPLTIHRESADLRSAVVYSKQALSFGPEDLESQSLFLAAILAEEGYRIGPDAMYPVGEGSAFNVAMTSDRDVVKRASMICMDTNHPQAVEAAFRVLSLTGDHTLFGVTDSGLSPLIVGLNHSSLRVQFAAAAAIVELRPQHGFRHSSRIVPILAQALKSDQNGKILMIDPNQDRGRAIASAAKRPQEVVTSGKEGFKLASSRSDIQMVFTHVNCVNWELSQTLANFRADARTAGIPIVIYGPTFLEDQLRTTVRRVPNTHYVVYSDDTVEVDRQLIPILLGQEQVPDSAAVRQRRAKAAASLLADLTRMDANRVFDLSSAEEALGEAVNDDELAADCLTALEAIPTAGAQRIILNVLLGMTRPQDLRVQAALSLSRHIRQYNLVLDQADVADVKDMWNSEQDPVLQTALATVVSTLRPSPLKTTDRLQNYPIAPFPVQNQP